MDLLEAPQSGAYACGMFDPPWRTQMRSKKGLMRSACRHYPTMKLDEIKALPVRQLMAKNSWVMLWTTPPHLQQAFQVLDAWGATYSSIMFTWVKLNPKAASALMLTTADFHRGTGYTTRKNTELCLLARYGQPKILKRVDELIIAARRQHSRKPDEAFYRARQFCPGPHIEVFSREERSGWDTWGNQVGMFSSGVSPLTFEEKIGMAGYRLPDPAPQLTADDDDASIPAFIRSTLMS